MKEPSRTKPSPLIYVPNARRLRTKETGSHCVHDKTTSFTSDLVSHPLGHYLKDSYKMSCLKYPSKHMTLQFKRFMFFHY